MDVAYNQFASMARRKNRSSTNLNHLSLAPLTLKLPLNDVDDLSDPLSAPRTTSYLEGRSAPTTPRLLSHSPGHSPPHKHTRGASTPAAYLSKSKSASHLVAPGLNRRKTDASPTSPHARGHHHEDSPLGPQDAADLLLRVGALISTEARESKGQSWLVSRASSTSLTGMAGRDADEVAAFERELAREAASHSRHVSHRGSFVVIDGDEGSRRSSPPNSRFGSRSHSRAALAALTPSECQQQRPRSTDGYFPSLLHDDGHDVPGPDFINLDETLEIDVSLDDEDTAVADEAHVRRLVKSGTGGVGSWFSNVLGFQLFAVEENEEESEGDAPTDDQATEITGEEGVLQEARRLRQLEGVTAVVDDRIPPPKADEGGWNDAAWFLSVATKVLL